QEHTAEDVLKTIQVPTLNVAGELDQFTPMWTSKKMNQLIPKSELFIMHSATDAGLVEQPDLINFRIEKFVRERVQRTRLLQTGLVLFPSSKDQALQAEIIFNNKSKKYATALKAIRNRFTTKEN